jgi:hypothetical protein
MTNPIVKIVPMPGPTGPTGATGPTGTLAGKYGAFEYTGRQAITDATQAYTFPWDTTDFSNGITTSNTTRINFTTTGIYNIQWSGQFQNTNGTDKDVSVWLAINNSPITGSTGIATIPGSHGSINGHAIVGWNYFISVTAGQYLEIKWSGETTAVSLESYSAGTSPTRPTTAALVLTVNQIA